MTSMNLVFRPSQKEGQHPGSLFLRLIHSRRIKTITLSGCSLYRDEWDVKQQLIIIPEEKHPRFEVLKQINELLEQAIVRVQSYLFSLKKEGRYTVEDLVYLFRESKDESKLLGYSESLARQLKKRGQVRTGNAYCTVARGIVKYNKGVDIALDQINTQLIKDFETHLKAVGKLPNTISYYMRNLRSIYNQAIRDGRTSMQGVENPFSKVYTGTPKTMKRSLTLDELQKLQDLNFATLLHKEPISNRRNAYSQNLEKAHRYFLFSFYARGMCFVDLAYLKKENLCGDILRYVRRKTGRQIEMRVTKEMQALIDSFSHEVQHSPYLLPIICDAKKDSRLQYETALRNQNLHLKELAVFAGLKKRISTHWARHSWATIGKQENLSIRVLSECLGHSSEHTTQIYLGLLDNSLLDAANDMVASAMTRFSITG